ncbi:MAG: DUF4350 domain-containing protein [Candidatus Eremiobacteraeota bacterium]|nr:DUF4350 domain-containing protein [Candidatus Eremiobacteraeota bacterium]
MIATLRRLPPVETAVFVLAVAILSTLGVLRQQAADRSAGSPDSYSTYDAASGGYRAWFELLSREGRAAERFERSPAFLPARIRTLVWAEPLPFDRRQEFLSKSEIGALERWVRAGGHLLYLGHDEEVARAKILHLPASVEPKTFHARASVAPFLRAQSVAAFGWYSKRRWKVPKGAAVLVADPRGAVIVRYPFGRGSVTAVVDEEPFQNAHIAEANNARLAYALAVERPGPLAFDEAAHGFKVVEHWWQIAPRALVVAVIVAVFALAVAFAGAAIRLGPPLVPAQRRDASSAEFVDAMAALLERGRAADDAVAGALHSTTRVVTRSLGLPDDAPPRTIAARLESPELRVGYTRLLEIAAGGRVDAPSLVRAIALAQHLRRECGAHGRPRN